MPFVPLFMRLISAPLFLISLPATVIIPPLAESFVITTSAPLLLIFPTILISPLLFVKSTFPVVLSIKPFAATVMPFVPLFVTLTLPEF